VTSPKGDLPENRLSTPMRRKAPPWLPRVVTESVLIVFSVLLALLLNEWRSSATQRHRAEQALGGPC
jgi:hypothetical protein